MSDFSRDGEAPCDARGEADREARRGSEARALDYSRRAGFRVTGGNVTNHDTKITVSREYRLRVARRLHRPPRLLDHAALGDGHRADSRGRTLAGRRLTRFDHDCAPRLGHLAACYLHRRQRLRASTTSCPSSTFPTMTFVRSRISAAPGATVMVNAVPPGPGGPPRSAHRGREFSVGATPVWGARGGAFTAETRDTTPTPSCDSGDCHGSAAVPPRRPRASRNPGEDAVSGTDDPPPMTKTHAARPRRAATGRSPPPSRCTRRRPPACDGTRDPGRPRASAANARRRWDWRRRRPPDRDAGPAGRASTAEIEKHLGRDGGEAAAARRGPRQRAEAAASRRGGTARRDGGGERGGAREGADFAGRPPRSRGRPGRHFGSRDADRPRGVRFHSPRGAGAQASDAARARRGRASRRSIHPTGSPW